MNKIRAYARTAATLTAGVIAALTVSVLPSYAATTFMAYDSNGAFTTLTPVQNGELLTHGGLAYTVVDEITRSDGYGGYYYQFHVTPNLVFTGQVQFTAQ